MFVRVHATRVLAAVALPLLLAGCKDSTGTSMPEYIAPDHVLPTLSWNRLALDLIASHVIDDPSSQARVLAYLSIAQLNAIVAAEDGVAGSTAPSAEAAVRAASALVLDHFFPEDALTIREQLRTQAASAAAWGERGANVAVGDSIGRAIGASALSRAATDRTDLTDLPPNPRGPNNWSGTNPTRGFLGARGFALTSPDQFRLAPPPAVGSVLFDEELTTLTEVARSTTPAQLALARTWRARGPAYMNALAAQLFALTTTATDRTVARTLALANMAGFDVANACFDTKFAYYTRRPSEVDPRLTPAFALANEPSYPSTHFCFTSAYAGILRRTISSSDVGNVLGAAMREDAESCLVGAMQFESDCTAGSTLGQIVAQNVLTTFAADRAIPLTEEPQ